MTAAIRGPYWTGASAPAGAVPLVRCPQPAFPLDQLVLGHRDRDVRQVEDLAALHPGHRPSRQPGPAPPAPARLMADLPVRPGHLRQRRAVMPVLAARLAAGLLPQRPRPRRRLVQALTGWRPGGIPRRLPQPRLQLSDPLPGLRQLPPRLLQRAQRIRQLPAQRCHQRGQNLLRRRSLLSGHTRTLRAMNAGDRTSRHIAGPAQTVERHRRAEPRHPRRAVSSAPPSPVLPRWPGPPARDPTRPARTHHRRARRAGRSSAAPCRGAARSRYAP